MVVSKKACITASFYFAYLTFLVFSMFGHIPTLDGYLKELTNVGLAMLVIIVCLRLRDYSAKEGIIFSVFLMFSLFMAFHTGDYGFFKLGMMIFASKGLDFRKIVKNDLCIRIILTIIMYILFVSGIAPDVTSNYNGVVRHSMGFQNPNHVGIVAFIIIMEILYLTEMQLTIPRYIVVFVILVVEDRIAGSRTAEFISLFAIVMAAAFSYMPQFYEKKYVNGIIRWGGLICASITGIAFFLFHSGNAVSILLDKLLSYRITNVSYYYDKLGVSLFGNNPTSINRTIDSLYGFTFIVLGVVSFIILMVAYYKLESKLCFVNKPLAIIMFCFFVYGLSERLWMYIDYNIFMLAFAELIYPYYTSDECYDEFLE